MFKLDNLSGGGHFETQAFCFKASVTWCQARDWIVDEGVGIVIASRNTPV